MVNQIKKSLILSGHKTSVALEKEFWDPIFANTNFKEFVKNQFTIGYKSEIDMDEILEMES